MATKHPHDGSGSDRDRGNDSGQHHEHRIQHDKGNASHIELEDRRFRGGLPPTPDLYALAREQWNKLPGSVVRPSMDPPITSDPPASSESEAPHSDENEADKDSQ